MNLRTKQLLKSDKWVRDYKMKHPLKYYEGDREIVEQQAKKIMLQLEQSTVSSKSDTFITKNGNVKTQITEPGNKKIRHSGEIIDITERKTEENFNQGVKSKSLFSKIREFIEEITGM